MEFTTTSLCPVCYREISARVFERDEKIWMEKTCCGTSIAIVDPDAKFHEMCRKVGGELDYRLQVCFLDVTDRCNMKCKRCYYPINNNSKDKPISRIVDDARVIRDYYGILRIILTGGEPTVRDDLPELIAELNKLNMSVEFITNGIRLEDKNYLNELCSSGLSTFCNGNTGIYFSIHLDKDERKLTALDNLRSKKIKILCMFWTIETVEDIQDVLKEISVNKDIAAQYRIRSQSPHWASVHSNQPQIFASDIYRRVRMLAEDDGGTIEVPKDTDTMSYRFNVIYNDLHLRLIHWPTEHNIDLQQHLCGPYYRARSGRVAHVIHTMLINQGMDNGMLNGERLNA